MRKQREKNKAEDEKKAEKRSIAEEIKRQRMEEQNN